MLRLLAFLFACCVAILADTSDASAEKRVALVIGNSDYKHAPVLNNPKNDADAMAQVLEKLGFQVVKGIDLSHADFARTVSEFRKKLVGADVGLFFYAGHGLQVHGRNYLAPIDAELENETSLNFQAIQLHVVLQLMERSAKTNLVFLDACRDNPLARNLARSMGTRSTAIGRGLAREETGLGTMISFATQPGNVALDGQGKNSPFAEAMLKHIETPGMDVALVMRKVREDVIDATSGSQVPWSNSSLTGSFTFKERSIAKAKPAPTPVPFSSSFNPKSLELSFWESIRNGNNPALYQEYLRRYPDGTFSLIANSKLEELEARNGQQTTQKEFETRNGQQTTQKEFETRNGQQTEQKVAALPDAEPIQTGRSSEDVSPLKGRDLARALQTELERVKCYKSRIDGNWGKGSRAALNAFNRYASLNLGTSQPTMDALNAVKNKSERVCPLTCGAQYLVQGDSCVKKTCPAGKRLSSKGQCIQIAKKTPATKPKAAPVSRPRKSKCTNNVQEARDQEFTLCDTTPRRTTTRRSRKKAVRNEFEECIRKWGPGACTAR